MKKELRQILDELANSVHKYESGAWQSKENLVKIQRSLSANVYYLTQHNIEAFQHWNKLKYEFKGSNASAETYAHEEIPELRLTRKILEAAKNVQISISNEISIIKNEG
ncbi:MAG: hypothetical protein AAF901_12785 [Bacteroidota bacterium]